jgi:hypothetical protein
VHCQQAASLNVEFKGFQNLLLALSMEVDALNTARNLVKANVVEALKARTTYRLDPMIRNQEVLLPAHKKVFFLHPVLCHEFRARRVFRERLVGRESSPVLSVDFLVGAPFRMLGYESVLASDDFAFEVGGQAGVVFC